MSAEEVADCERQVKSLQAKTDMERQNTTKIGDINEYAFLKAPAKKEEQKKEGVAAHIVQKYDWYQNKSHVFVTFKVVGDKDLAKQAKIDIQKQSISVETDNQNFSIPLAMEVDPELSQTYPFSQKIEMKLKKVTED